MDSPDNIELSVEKKQSKSIHTFEEAVSLIGMYSLELATLSMASFVFSMNSLSL